MILIGGGSRSGKTRFALNLSRKYGTRLAYVATAELLDEEMQGRAARHREERGSAFVTIEEPRNLATLIEQQGGNFDAMVVDCLTLWLSNVMLSTPAEPPEASTRLLCITAARAATQIIFVTNEVGCGIVPDNQLAREFRDHAGWLNQAIAEQSTEVYWMAFGCPLKVKG
ncbi:MAG TPA: bifunctional adenosylcobinamide kinase/adenosylcobinamide-phosphate guanylyltransferase [Bryobacteraceae bacterium]|nr:bifunctional adenosylcobinamide kinase/adenosylcobinamide-phosphate guanylyltransferase [Bryobacteraceae bacterium]